MINLTRITGIMLQSARWTVADQLADVSRITQRRTGPWCEAECRPALGTWVGLASNAVAAVESRGNRLVPDTRLRWRELGEALKDWLIYTSPRLR
jgi:hypothetical protein